MIVWNLEILPMFYDWESERVSPFTDPLIALSGSHKVGLSSGTTWSKNVHGLPVAENVEPKGHICFFVD